MQIRFDHLPNGYRVSTIFLNSVALDMDSTIVKIYELLGVTGDVDDHVQKLKEEGDYETMVFGDIRGRDVDFRRYKTEEEAIQGHKEMVEKWRNK